MIKLEQKALWIDSMGVYHADPAIVKACTFKDKFHNDFCLAVVKGDKVLVPINMVKTTASDRRVTAPFTTPMVCQAPPRDEDQDRCIKESISLLKQGINHCLKAPTGWGKSYAGVAIACALGEKTLILVTKDDLIDSWMKNLVEVAKIPKGRIGLVKGKVVDWQGKDFVIGTVQSVVRDGKLPQEFFMYFGLLIPDEVHRMGADYFMQAMVMVQARLRLGLSATPKRQDGRMFAVRAHIGEVLVEGVNVPMQPKVLRVKSGWKVPNISEVTGKKVIYSAGRLASVYAEMARSPQRNKLIVDFALQAKNAGRTVVVMAEHKEHLTNVYRAMLDAGINAIDMGMYVGGLKTKAERDIQAHKPIVFATYQFCSEGTDYPHWDTLVYATPRAQAEQTAGRVMRKLDGKKMPVILDLIDDNALLKGYASGRLKDYYKVGAVIVNMWES